MVVGPSETMLTGEEWEQPIISLNKSQNLCVCAYGTEGRSNCVISSVFWNYKMHAAGWIRTHPKKHTWLELKIIPFFRPF